MPSIVLKSQASTFGDLLQLGNGGAGLTQNMVIEDGKGVSTSITVGPNYVSFSRDGDNTFNLDDEEVTALVSMINSVCSATPSFPDDFPVKLPVGTTLTRPDFTEDGQFWLNSTTGDLEIFFNGVWKSIILV